MYGKNEKCLLFLNIFIDFHGFNLEFGMTIDQADEVLTQSEQLL